MIKLNKIEKLKEKLLPFNYNIKEVDFSNLSQDDRFYLKNFGIYNINLAPDIFMIRIRVAGGRIGLDKLKYILNLAKSYNLELIITARAGLELHKIKPKDVLKVYESLRDFGINTHQSLTDNFRNFVTTPLDGCSIYSKIETYPLILQMQSAILDNKEWFGVIPRKFNVAICGQSVTNLAFFSNDLFFALAKKDDIWGFNIYLGGKNSNSAVDANIFIEPSEVKDFFLAVAKAYKKYGLRGTRAKTRLYHLIEQIGLEEFKAKVKEFYKKEFKLKGEFAIKKGFSLELKGNKYAKDINCNFGKVNLKRLEEILEQNREVRFGIDQKLYVLDTMPQDSNFLNITACAGSRYCPLSLWDIKDDVKYLPLDRLSRLKVSVGFSGCLKGCARHQHSDIGLIGLRTNIYGKTEKGARVFLGAIYSKSEPKAARMVFTIVPLRELNSVINIVLDEFENSSFSDFEEFSKEILNSFSEGFLMVWFLSKLLLGHNLNLSKESEAILFKRLQNLPNFPKIEDSKNYYNLIEELKHSIWDIKDK